MLTLQKIVKSNQDNTIKYIFKNDKDFTLEFSFIDKNDSKFIICVPTQTMCNMGCKFCHLTGHKVKVEDLNWMEINHGIITIISDLKLTGKPILISFMGCGEPIVNHRAVLDVMTHLTLTSERLNLKFRFGLATSLPKKYLKNFFELANEVYKEKFPLKIHLSLHYTEDEIRKEWMPSSLEIAGSIAALNFYNKLTGNPIEIHYCLIDGVNDTEKDAYYLCDELGVMDVNVKFMFYNEKPDFEFHKSSQEKYNIFKNRLDQFNISSEYYIPPGLDIGASCGQFLMEEYL